MNWHDLIGGFVTGTLGGLFSGFLGVTSGGILVPLLILILGKEQHVAQGISLVAQVVPTSLSGVRNYSRSGHRISMRWVILAEGACVAPKAKGATRLAAPNRRLSSTSLRPASRGLARRPSATLRRTIASNATVNGASNAVPSAENAAGNAENRSVIEKISQTWLASQTGPIVAAIACRSSARPADGPASAAAARPSRRRQAGRRSGRSPGRP